MSAPITPLSPNPVAVTTPSGPSVVPLRERVQAMDEDRSDTPGKDDHMDSADALVPGVFAVIAQGRVPLLMQVPRLETGRAERATEVLPGPPAAVTMAGLACALPAERPAGSDSVLPDPGPRAGGRRVVIPSAATMAAPPSSSMSAATMATPPPPSTAAQTRDGRATRSAAVSVLSGNENGNGNVETLRSPASPVTAPSRATPRASAGASPAVHALPLRTPPAPLSPAVPAAPGAAPQSTAPTPDERPQVGQRAPVSFLNERADDAGLPIAAPAMPAGPEPDPAVRERAKGATDGQDALNPLITAGPERGTGQTGTPNARAAVVVPPPPDGARHASGQAVPPPSPSTITVPFQSWGTGHSVIGTWSPAGTSAAGIQGITLRGTSGAVTDAMQTASVGEGAAGEATVWRIAASDPSGDAPQRRPPPPPAEEDA